MMDKPTISRLISEATGGQNPSVGDSIVFSIRGWVFQPASDIRWLGVVASDPATPLNDQMWYNSVDNRLRIKTTGGVFESPLFTLVP